MHFYEKLTELMEQHDVRSKDLYPRLNLNKSRFSKIKNGGFIPESLQVVEKIAEIMRLNPGEYDDLLNAWIGSRYGSSPEETSRLIHRFYSITEPYEPVMPAAAPDVQNGTLLKGKEKVIQAAMQVLHAETEAVRLDFIPDDEQVCESVRRILSALPAQTPLKWLLALDNRNGVSSRNLQLFINAVPVMLQHQAVIRSPYLHTEELRELTFPYSLTASQTVLLFSREMECALFLKNEAIQKQYAAHFEMRFRSARERFHTFDGVAEFLGKGASVFGNTLPEKQVFYIIDQYPCMINYIPLTEMKGHMSQDYQDPDRLMGYYASFLAEYQRFVSEEYSLFWQHGLYDVLTQETHYVYPRSVCKSLPKALRREAIGKMIQSLRKETIFHAGMIRKPYPEGTIVHGVNLFSDGKCILMFNIRETMKLIVFEESDIVRSVMQYVKILKDVGIICNTHETIQELEKMLMQTE